jgi:myb proto-oncogene protein
MRDRTDNDIKNYWNTHLRKKLAKTCASESGASGGSAKRMGDGAAAPAPAPKGQWERQLQTDMHTARQALQEALSIDTAPPPAVAIKPEPLPLAQLPAPALSPAMYACSIENVVRVLELWMQRSASEKASAQSMTSVSAVSGGGEGGSGSQSGTARALEGFTGMTKVDGAGGAGPGPSSSLPMLESWLLDDSGMGHGDEGLFCVPLADPCEFF